MEIKKNKNITLVEPRQHVIRSQMKAIFTGVSETYTEMCVNTCVAVQSPAPAAARLLSKLGFFKGSFIPQGHVDFYGCYVLSGSWEGGATPTQQTGSQKLDISTRRAVPPGRPVGTPFVISRV